MCIYVHPHVCTYTPGGLLRKPPLKCAIRAAPMFCAQINHTNTSVRGSEATPGAVGAHYAQRPVCVPTHAIKDLCARLPLMYAQKGVFRSK